MVRSHKTTGAVATVLLLLPLLLLPVSLVVVTAVTLKVPAVEGIMVMPCIRVRGVLVRRPIVGRAVVFSLLSVFSLLYVVVVVASSSSCCCCANNSSVANQKALVIQRHPGQYSIRSITSPFPIPCPVPPVLLLLVVLLVVVVSSSIGDCSCCW